MRVCALVRTRARGQAGAGGLQRPPGGGENERAEQKQLRAPRRHVAVASAGSAQEISKQHAAATENATAANKQQLAWQWTAVAHRSRTHSDQRHSGLATRPRAIAALPAVPTSSSAAAARTAWRAERRSGAARRPAVHGAEAWIRLVVRCGVQWCRIGNRQKGGQREGGEGLESEGQCRRRRRRRTRQEP